MHFTEHSVTYVPRSQGGADWSGAGAGYIASCTCGAWTYGALVERPASPANRRAAEAAWLQHALTAG